MRWHLFETPMPQWEKKQKKKLDNWIQTASKVTFWIKGQQVLKNLVVVFANKWSQNYSDYQELKFYIMTRTETERRTFAI